MNANKRKEIKEDVIKLISMKRIMNKVLVTLIVGIMMIGQFDMLSKVMAENNSAIMMNTLSTDMKSKTVEVQIRDQSIVRTQLYCDDILIKSNSDLLDNQLEIFKNGNYKIDGLNEKDEIVASDEMSIDSFLDVFIIKSDDKNQLIVGSRIDKTSQIIEKNTRTELLLEKTSYGYEGIYPLSAQIDYQFVVEDSEGTVLAEKSYKEDFNKIIGTNHSLSNELSLRTAQPRAATINYATVENGASIYSSYGMNNPGNLLIPGASVTGDSLYTTSNPYYITVDLGQERNIYGIDFYWSAWPNFANQWEVQASNSPTSGFSTVMTDSDAKYNNGGGSRKSVNVTARYWRVLLKRPAFEAYSFTMDFLKLTNTPSNNAYLDNVEFHDDVIWSEPFSYAKTTYDIQIPNSMKLIYLKVTPQDSGAIVYCGNDVFEPGSYCYTNIGDNATGSLTISSMAETGSLINYTFRYTRSPISSNSSLADLSFKQSVSLSPGFSSATTSYNATVPYTMSSLDIIPLAQSGGAEVTVQGTKADPKKGGRVGLSIGDNSIPIVVTAEDGSTTTYTLDIRRKSNASTLSSLDLNDGAISYTFSSSTINYTVEVPNNLTTITFKPRLAHSGASVKINGVEVANNTNSAAVAIPNETNTIRVVVTAEDTNYSTTYTYTIKRTFYSLKYHANGGSGIPTDNSNYRIGDTANINFTTIPTKTNYTFVGWDTNASATTPTYTATGTKTMTVNSDVTLYAIYKVKPSASIDITPQHYAFDATTKAFVIKGTPSSGYVVQYQQNGVDVTPKEIGAYDVIVTRTEDSYSSYSQTIPDGLIIDKINFEDVVTVNEYKGVYDGKAHELGLVLDPIISDATMTYYTDNTYMSTTSQPSYTNVGKYTVYFKVTRRGMDDWKSQGIVEITKKDLKAIYDGQSIIFGTTPTAGIHYEGFVNGETKTVLDSEPTLPTLPTTVGQHTITPLGGSDNNYNYVYQSGTLTINKATFKPSEITATGYTGAYDGAFHKLNIALSGNAVGADITYQEGNTTTIATSLDGKTSQIGSEIEKKNVGTYQIRYTIRKEGYEDYTGMETIKITPKQVEVNNVTVSDKVYDGRTDTNNVLMTLNGVVTNETVSVAGDVTFTNKNVGTNKTLEVNNLVLQGIDASNYILKNTSLSNLASSTKITQKEVTLNWSGLNTRTYDGTNSHVSASASGVALGETLSVSVSNGTKKDAGTYNTTASITDSNYTIKNGDESQTYTIEKAMLTATYKGSSVIYKDNIPNDIDAYDITGFISGENKTNLTTAPTVSAPSGETWASLTPRTYSLKPAGGVATNYDFTYVAGDLVVLSRDFDTLVLQDYIGDYDGQNHGIFTKNDDTLATDLNLRFYDSEAEMNADVNGTGGTLTPTVRQNVGTTTVYMKAFNPHFNSKEATLKITINKRKITPTITGIQSKMYDGTTDATASLNANNGVVGEDLKLNADIHFTDKNIGSNKPIQVTNITTGNSNYELTSTSLDMPSTASITVKPIEINWINKSTSELIYSGIAKDVNAEIVTGELVSGDTCTVNVTGGNQKNVGSYSATASLNNANYSIKANHTLSYEITKKDLTVKYKDEAIAYGMTPVKELSYSGFVNGENENNLSSTDFTAPTIKTVIPTEARDNAYVMELQGGAAKNYSIHLDNTGTLKIDKSRMPLTVNRYSGIYDGQLHGITMTAPTGSTIQYYSDVDMNNELIGDASKVKDATSSPKTIYYKVTHPNYNVETGSSTISIQPKEIVPSVLSIEDKVYDGNTKAVGSMKATGGIGNEDLALSAIFNFNNKNVGINKELIVTNIATGNPNYIVSINTLNQTSTAKITAKQVEIEWKNNNLSDLVYSGIEKDVKAQVVAGELVSGDTCTVNVTGGNQKNVGSYSATASLNNANYSIKANSTLSYEITKKDLTVKFKNEEIHFGDTPLLILNYEGFVNGEDENNLSSIDFTAPTIKTVIPTQVSDTPYSIELQGGTAKNYSIHLDNTGTLLIKKIKMPLVVKGYTGIYDGKLHGITLEAPVGSTNQYYSDEAMTNELIGDEIKIKDAQTKTIYYRVVHSNYAIEEGHAKIIIEPKEIVPSVLSIEDKVYDGSTEAVGRLEATGGIGNEDLQLSAIFNFKSKDVGKEKVVEVTNIQTRNTNYQLTTDTITYQSTANITPKKVDIIWQNRSEKDLVYSGKNKNVEAVVKDGDLVGFDNCEVKVDGGHGKDVGSYKAKASLNNGNYSIQNKSTLDYSVTKKPLTVSYKEETMILGKTPKAELLYQGFVDGENENNASDFEKPSIVGDLPTKLGTHKISLSGGKAKNYEVKLDNTGSLTIVKEETPVITIGDNFTYEINSNEIITIRCSAKLEDFIEAYVDGNRVNKKHYRLESGSTILTFNKEYLDTLTAGKHELKLVYTGERYVETSFTIIEKSQDVKPETSDYTKILPILMVLVISAGCFVFGYRKKRNKEVI